MQETSACQVGQTLCLTAQMPRTTASCSHAVRQPCHLTLALWLHQAVIGTGVSQWTPGVGQAAVTAPGTSPTALPADDLLQVLSRDEAESL